MGVVDEVADGGLMGSLEEEMGEGVVLRGGLRVFSCGVEWSCPGDMEQGIPSPPVTPLPPPHAVQAALHTPRHLRRLYNSRNALRSGRYGVADPNTDNISVPVVTSTITTTVPKGWGFGVQ